MTSAHDGKTKALKMSCGQEKMIFTATQGFTIAVTTRRTKIKPLNLSAADLDDALRRTIF